MIWCSLWFGMFVNIVFGGNGDLDRMGTREVKSERVGGVEAEARSMLRTSVLYANTFCPHYWEFQGFDSSWNGGVVTAISIGSV